MKKTKKGFLVFTMVVVLAVGIITTAMKTDLFKSITDPDEPDVGAVVQTNYLV